MCIPQCSARVYKRTRTYVQEKKKKENKTEKQKKKNKKKDHVSCGDIVVWRKKENKVNR